MSGYQLTGNLVNGVSLVGNFQQNGPTITGSITTGGTGETGPEGPAGPQGPPGPVGSVDAYFNIKTYGAVGDGVNDNTLAIQAAIDAAHAGGGGVVFVPTGNYVITSNLVVYEHISFLGQGDGAVDGSGGGMGTAASTITQTSTSHNAITGVDVIDFNIQQLTFTGPGSGTGKGLELTLNFHDDSRYIHLVDSTFQNFGSDGIAIDTLIISQFERVVCYGNGRYGFNLHASGASASTSLTATSCWAHNNTSNGWNIDHMVYSNFISCGADVNGAIGYLVNNCQSVSLVSCGAESNTGNGYKVTSASYNVSLLSCWNFNNSSIAAYVTGSSISTTIVGFHENTPTGSPTASVKVDSGCTGTNLIGGFFVTAQSLASGTTTILNDSAGNMTVPAKLEVGGLIQGDSIIRGTDFELTNTSGSIAINAHYNSGWKYLANGAASLISSDGAGGLIIYSAPSGTAGNAITFTQRASISTSSSTFSALVSATLQITGGTPGTGKVLTSDASGNATWQSPSSGFTNPMTTSGDIIYGGASGTATRLAKGSDGKVLTLASGIPSWASPSSGLAAGSITGIIVAASNAPTDWTTAATYTCDGTADNVEIQSAITAAKSDGRKIYLSPGTFNIATTIAIAGDDITDSDNAISITGAGAYQTNLVAGTNVTIMKLSDSCKVNIHNLLFNVNGSGAGIQSRAVTTSDPYRAFWNSSFKNLLFRGNANQTNHTGWAMDLGSPFRSTFENIEAYNVANGIKLFSENAAFNPGDCTFTRCFMELGLNSGGIGYYLNGDASVMNHCAFIICEAFAYGASATGIKMDGTTGTMWNRFIGTNLEQFTTVVDIVSGEGNIVDCNYIAGKDGTTSTIFKTEAGAYNNRLSSGFAYMNVSGTVWNDANTTTAQPNEVHHTKLYCDTGATATLTTVTGSVTEGNTSDGAGTPPTAWARNTRVETLYNKTMVAPALGTPASGVATNLTGTAASLTAGNATKLATARTIAGSSFDGSANTTLANKFILQGTADAGVTAAQFLGALGTGILKNTTTTGVLSIAVAADFPTLNQNTTGSAATLTTARTIAGVSFNGSANIAIASTNLSDTASIALLTSAQTLTNKRLNPRVVTTASSATPTPASDTTDIFILSAQAAAAAFVNPTGTPVDGQKLMVQIKDNSTARAITWGTAYLASGVAALLTTTVISKTHRIFFVYDATAVKWVCMAVDAAGY